MVAKDTEYWDKDGNKMYQPPKRNEKLKLKFYKTDGTTDTKIL